MTPAFLKHGIAIAQREIGNEGEVPFLTGQPGRQVSGVTSSPRSRLISLDPVPARGDRVSLDDLTGVVPEHEFTRTGLLEGD